MTQHAAQPTAEHNMLPVPYATPQLATKHKMLPVIPLNTTYCETNCPTQHTTYHEPQLDMLLSERELVVKKDIVRYEHQLVVIKL